MNERPAIGALVRSLRLQRGLTGIELGIKAGISQSKISKIESGAIPRPAAREIIVLLNILQAPDNILQQVDSLLGKPATLPLAEGLNETVDQLSILNQERQSKTIRIFVLSVIPAFLQTLQYRQSLLVQYGYDKQRTQEDLKIILERQELLWSDRRHFHFILHEAALYTRLSDVLTHARQLDRLERLSLAANIQIGIIPTRSGLDAAEHGPFAIYDDKLVAQPHISGQDNLFSGQQTIRICLAIFNAYEKKARYDESAVKMIREAVDYTR